MEVQINGEKGESIHFRIGVIALIQVIVAAATFAGAMRVAQADINRLENQQSRFEQKIDEMLGSQRRMEATIEALRDELRYYREKMDRHIENTKYGEIGKEKP